MIEENELTSVGKLGKPHGINGEINAYLDEDVAAERLDKIIVNIDGIYVPFFIESMRRKRVDTMILALDGIDNEQQAAELTNHEIFALLTDEVKETPDGGDGMYASDLIGYTIVHANGVAVGTVTDVEDSTENALFIVTLPDGTVTYVPIADELIDDIDEEKKLLVMTLPEGLLEL